MPSMELLKRTQAFLNEMIPDDQDLDAKVLRLVEAEYVRELGRYRRVDLALVRKYGMTFESFIECRIPRQREYSWEVEQDAMAWETAVGGMATVERKLRELRAFSDERTG